MESRPITDPEDDYEGGKECPYCGRPVSDLRRSNYCSRDHEIADNE